MLMNWNGIWWKMGDKYVEMPEETKGKISIVVTAKNGFNVMVPQPSWLLPVRGEK